MNSENTKFLIMFVFAVIATIAPELSSADSSGLDETVGESLCDIVEAMQGTVGKGIATLSVLFLGIGAFFGKVNWGLVVMVGVGIAAIFGGNEIVDIITDADKTQCGKVN